MHTVAVVRTIGDRAGLAPGLQEVVWPLFAPRNASIGAVAVGGMKQRADRRAPLSISLCSTRRTAWRWTYAGVIRDISPGAAVILAMPVDRARLLKGV